MPLVRKSSTPAPPPPPPPSDALLERAKHERWAAARAMTAPEDVPALAAALEREGDASVREALLSSLCRIGTSEAAGAIAIDLHSDDANVRRGALDALRSIPRAAGSVLPALLADGDADVRLLSCEIARELPSGEATSLMTALLSKETSANVCAAAIETLSDIGSPAALPTLAAVAQRFASEPFLQFAAEAAIERIAASADNKIE